MKRLGILIIAMAIGMQSFAAAPEVSLNGVQKENYKITPQKKNISGSLLINDKQVLDELIKLQKEKDLADIRAQFPEGKRLLANGPVKMYRIRKITKWCDAICAFDVHISELGNFSSKRTVYTLDNVSVFFYHKNSDGIGQEIILKNKFFRKRKIAGKSKEL